MLTPKEAQYLCATIISSADAGGGAGWVFTISQNVTKLSKLAKAVAPGVAAGLKKKGFIQTQVDKVPMVVTTTDGWDALASYFRVDKSAEPNVYYQLLTDAKALLANAADPLPPPEKTDKPSGKGKTVGKAWAHPERKIAIMETLKGSAAGWVIEVLQQVGDVSRDEAELYYCFQALAETAIKGMKIAQIVVVLEEEPETDYKELADEQSLDIALVAISGVGMNRYDLIKEEEGK